MDTEMDIDVTQVNSGGLNGVLCAPPGGGPGVLLVGGSEGGLHARDARVLAAEGFTVLALAYFAAPAVPPGLVEIRLEYFRRGLDLLRAQPGADGRLGMIGGSRGGEAALLVASHDERIGAVVSVAGSGVVTAGIDYPAGALPDILRRSLPSWTVEGRPLPYLPYADVDAVERLNREGQPVPLRIAFPPLPQDIDELDRVSIPVERISGRVLSVCGADDQMWPSADYSQVAVERMTAHQRAGDIDHRVLPGVGHPIAGPPGSPFTTTTSPGPGTTFEMGGTAQHNTAARASTWAAGVQFFRRELGSGA